MTTATSDFQQFMKRRAEIAHTYGATGGVVYTVAQIGCSGILLLGGLGLVVVALLLKR